MITKIMTNKSEESHYIPNTKLTRFTLRTRKVNLSSFILTGSKGHPAHPVLFVCAQKMTNFVLWRMVYEPFTDGVAQVCSPIHTYAHLVREPFGTHQYTGLKTGQNSNEVEWAIIDSRYIISD